MSYLDKNNPSSGKYEGAGNAANSGEQMVASRILDFDATAAAAVQAVSIPLGATVTKVVLVFTTALVSGDVDVGDGSSADRYIDGITAADAAEVVVAPFPYSTTSASNADFTAHDEQAGRYYAAADTIDVTVNATATAGSGRVLVWYTLGDLLGT